VDVGGLDQAQETVPGCALLSFSLLQADSSTMAAIAPSFWCYSLFFPFYYE
jgi:hypothetical protein